MSSTTLKFRRILWLEFVRNCLTATLACTILGTTRRESDTSHAARLRNAQLHPRFLCLMLVCKTITFITTFIERSKRPHRPLSALLVAHDPAWGSSNNTNISDRCDQTPRARFRTHRHCLSIQRCRFFPFPDPSAARFTIARAVSDRHARVCSTLRRTIDNHRASRIASVSRAQRRS